MRTLLDFVNESMQSKILTRIMQSDSWSKSVITDSANWDKNKGFDLNSFPDEVFTYAEYHADRQKNGGPSMYLLAKRDQSNNVYDVDTTSEGFVLVDKKLVLKFASVSSNNRIRVIAVRNEYKRQLGRVKDIWDLHDELQNIAAKSNVEVYVYSTEDKRIQTRRAARPSSRKEVNRFETPVTSMLINSFTSQNYSSEREAKAELEKIIRSASSDISDVRVYFSRNWHDENPTFPGTMDITIELNKQGNNSWSSKIELSTNSEDIVKFNASIYHINDLPIASSVIASVIDKINAEVKSFFNIDTEISNKIDKFRAYAKRKMR